MPRSGPPRTGRRAPVCAPPSVGLSGLLHSLRSPPRLNVATRHHICSHLLQCYRREAGILGEGRAPPAPRPNWPRPAKKRLNENVNQSGTSGQGQCTHQGHRPYVLTMLRRRAVLRPLVNPSPPGIHKGPLARLLVTPKATLTPPLLGPEKTHKSRENLSTWYAFAGLSSRGESSTI